MPPVSASSADKEPAHILILYDSLARGTTREGNVEALQRLLASYGAKITLSTLDGYKQGTLKSYSKVAVVRNLADLPLINSDYLKDFEAFEGDYLHIGEFIPAQVQAKLNIQTKTTVRDTIQLSIGQLSQSLLRVENMSYMVRNSGISYGSISSANGDFQASYAAREGRFAVAPYFERGNLSELALAYVLKDWLGAAAQSYTYLLFQEVYPFSDLKLLEKLSDKLYSAGIPFMISVSPVFSNFEYPAMQRYLETLKYVQSRNGSILVNAPVVASTISQEGNSLKGKMTAFVDALAQYGIAPLGMGAELYWAYDKEYALDGMGFFDSAVLFPNQQTMYKSQTDSSRPFVSSMYSLSLQELQQYKHTGRALQAFPMNTALTLKFHEQGAELDKSVQNLITSWVTFADYKYGAHKVQTDTNTIVSQEGSLLINGQHVDLSDAKKEISADFAYVQEEQKSFSKLFNFQNTVFIIIIVLTLLVFGFLFIIGYRLYRRKYYK
ncbi:MAG: hypothetical protein K0R67_991 [Paenibacillus sp.]|nr:hypothetical protein [Paenibacillus sp.]